MKEDFTTKLMKSQVQVEFTVHDKRHFTLEDDRRENEVECNGKAGIRKAKLSACRGEACKLYSVLLLDTHH